MNTLHFETQNKAWDFIKSISGKIEIIDYGVDKNRIINSYYVIVGRCL